jgi:hypothetical protein
MLKPEWRFLSALLQLSLNYCYSHAKYRVQIGGSMKHLKIALLLIGLVSTFALPSAFSAQDEPACTTTVGANDSLQLAIDLFGFTDGAVICIGEGNWNDNLLIKSSLTLRGLGPELSIVSAQNNGQPIVHIESEFSPINVQISGIYFDVATCENNCNGIRIQGQPIVSIDNVKIDGALVGLFPTDSSIVTFSNSVLSGSSAWGVLASGDSQVSFDASVVEQNSGSGILYGSTGVLEVLNSDIRSNGLRPECQELGDGGIANCAGIIISGEGNVLIRESRILDNVDWGVSAWDTACNYADNLFTGSVTFEGENELSGNNASGNQDGVGNPGVHPWSDTSDGQVCLP